MIFWLQVNQLVALFGLLAIFALISISTEEIFIQIGVGLHESMKKENVNELISNVQRIIPLCISFVAIIPVSIFSCLYSAMFCSTMNFLMNEKQTISTETNEIKNFTLTELNKVTDITNTGSENIMETT